MGKSDYYAPGQWNIECDQCGQKFKSSQVKKQWDGLIVCKRCYDPRHPQDFVRGVSEKQSVPFTRPESTDDFTDGATSLTNWDDQ